MRPIDLRKNTIASDLQSVSVSSCCHHKIPQTEHYSLMFWRLGLEVELDFLEQSILGFEMTAFSFGSLMAFSLCRYRIKTATEKCRMIILSSEHSHGY